MSELQWLALATFLLAVICFVVSGHDRQLVIRWWRRRRARREKPWSNLVLTFLPFVLVLVAVSLAFLGAQGKPKPAADPTPTRAGSGPF